MRRLEEALAEQGRRRRQYEAAFEASDEPNAHARLSEARGGLSGSTSTGTEEIDRASEEDEMSTSKQSQPAATARRASSRHWRPPGWPRYRTLGHIAPGTRAGDRRLHGERPGR